MIEKIKFFTVVNGTVASDQDREIALLAQSFNPNAASTLPLSHAAIEFERTIWERLELDPDVKSLLLENFENIDKKAYFKIIADQKASQSSADIQLKQIQTNIDNCTYDIFENLTDKPALLNFYTAVANDVALYLAQRENTLKSARNQAIQDVEQTLLEVLNENKQINLGIKKQLFKIIDDLTPEALYEKADFVDSLPDKLTVDKLFKQFITLFKAHLNNTPANIEPLKILLKSNLDITIKNNFSDYKPKVLSAWQKYQRSLGPVIIFHLAEEVLKEPTKKPDQYLRQKAMKQALNEHGAKIITFNEKNIYTNISNIPNPATRDAVRDSYVKIYTQLTADYKKQEADLQAVMRISIKQSLIGNTGETRTIENIRNAATLALKTRGVPQVFAQTYAQHYLTSHYGDNDNIKVISSPDAKNINQDAIISIQKNTQSAYVNIATRGEDYSREGADRRLEAVKGEGVFINSENSNEAKRRRALQLKKNAVHYAIEVERQNNTLANKLQAADTATRREEEILYDDHRNKKILNERQKQRNATFDNVGKPAARGFAAFTSMNTTITLTMALVFLIPSLSLSIILAGPIAGLLFALATGYTLYAQGIIDFHEYDSFKDREFFGYVLKMGAIIKSCIKYGTILAYVAAAVSLFFIFGFAWPLYVSLGILATLGGLTYLYMQYNKDITTFSPEWRTIHKFIIFTLLSGITIGLGFMLAVPAAFLGISVAAFAVGFVINHYLQRLSISEALKKKFGTTDKHGIMRFYQGYIQDNNLGKYQVVALVLTTIFLNTTMAVLYASIGHEKLMELATAADFIMPGIGGSAVQTLAIASFIFIFTGYLLLTTGPMARAIQLVARAFNNLSNFYKDKNKIRSEFGFRSLFKSIVGLWYQGVVNPAKSATGYNETNKNISYGYNNGFVAVGAIVIGVALLPFTLVGLAANYKNEGSVWYQLYHYGIRGPGVLLGNLIWASMIALLIPAALFGMAALLIMSGDSFGNILKEWSGTTDDNSSRAGTMEMTGKSFGVAGIIIKAPLVVDSCVKFIMKFCSNDDPLSKESKILYQKANNAAIKIQELENMVAGAGKPSQSFVERYKIAATDPSTKSKFEYFGYWFIRLGNALLNGELASDFISDYETYINDDGEEVPTDEEDRKYNMLVFIGAFYQSAALSQIGMEALGKEKYNRLAKVIDKITKKVDYQKFDAYAKNPNNYELAATATTAPAAPGLKNAFSKTKNNCGQTNYTWNNDFKPTRRHA